MLPSLKRPSCLRHTDVTQRSRGLEHISHVHRCDHLERWLGFNHGGGLNWKIEFLSSSVYSETAVSMCVLSSQLHEKVLRSGQSTSVSFQLIKMWHCLNMGDHLRSTCSCCYCGFVVVVAVGLFRKMYLWLEPILPLLCSFLKSLVIIGKGSRPLMNGWMALWLYEKSFWSLMATLCCIAYLCMKNCISIFWEIIKQHKKSKIMYRR